MVSKRNKTRCPTKSPGPGGGLGQRKLLGNSPGKSIFEESSTRGGQEKLGVIHRGVILVNYLNRGWSSVRTRGNSTCGVAEKIQECWGEGWAIKTVNMTVRRPRTKKLVQKKKNRGGWGGRGARFFEGKKKIPGGARRG